MPTLNTLRPLTKVTVQGYDQKQARRFEASAPAGAAPGRTSAAEVASAAGRRVETVVVDQPLESQAQAQQLADAVYDRATLDLISGTGATVGVPTLRAGCFVTLGGLGDVFDGDYTVTQATHTISSGGYLTSFNAHKGTVG
jgi:phage protein D